MGAGSEGGEGERDRMLAVREATREAGLGEGKEHVLYRLIGDGEVRAIKVGGVHRVPASEARRVRRRLEEDEAGYTPEEVAKDLGVHPRTARRWMGAGDPPARKRLVGHGMVAPRAAYEGWKARRLGGPPAAARPAP